jgi:Protein of unknown function (DUF1236)
MTRFLVSIGAAALLTSAALAQTSTTTTTTTTGSLSSNSVTFSPAEETKIKEYVTKEKRSVAAPSGFSLSVGADVPQSVELYSFPSDVGVAKYRYTVIGGKTALVDPSTRKVVRVIEQ